MLLLLLLFPIRTQLATTTYTGVMSHLTVYESFLKCNLDFAKYSAELQLIWTTRDLVLNLNNKFKSMLYMYMDFSKVFNTKNLNKTQIFF